jgi:hypothetical protein
MPARITLQLKRSSKRLSFLFDFIPYNLSSASVREIQKMASIDYVLNVGLKTTAIRRDLSKKGISLPGTSTTTARL